MAAMTNKLALKSEPLPQDNFEGVEDDEWVSKETHRPHTHTHTHTYTHKYNM